MVNYNDTGQTSKGADCKPCQRVLFDVLARGSTDPVASPGQGFPTPWTRAGLCPATCGGAASATLRDFTSCDLCGAFRALRLTTGVSSPAYDAAHFGRQKHQRGLGPCDPPAGQPVHYKIHLLGKAGRPLT